MWGSLALRLRNEALVATAEKRRFREFVSMTSLRRIRMAGIHAASQQSAAMSDGG
jgi:hypothetical protein